MKKILLPLFLLYSYNLLAQTSTNTSRIVLNAVVFDKSNKLPGEAKSQLESKLNQIASDNGVGGNSINPRFIIAAKINIISKDIIAGPPQMVALNLEAVFFVGDAVDNQIYANTTVTLKGVGTNENKALISAVQNVAIKNEMFAELVNTGKSKIVAYYSQKCDLITKRAATLSQQQNFDQAIYELMQVPDVCKACYDRCLEAVQPIYQKKIDRESMLSLTKAKAAWSANQNINGATEAADLLGKIEPLSASFKEGLELSERIRKKVEADEKREWEFKMKGYADGVRLDELKVEASRQTAIEFYKNQPEIIIYNRLIW
jgi:hypothetical protein